MTRQFVYFIKPIGTNGPIKIGCSACPAGRVKQISSDTKVALELIAAVPGDFEVERGLHRFLEADRCDAPFAQSRAYPIGGAREWFRPSPALCILLAVVKETGKIPDGVILICCRETEFVRRRSAGETYASIGRDYGVSRQRVHQVIQWANFKHARAA